MKHSTGMSVQQGENLQSTPPLQNSKEEHSANVLESASGKIVTKVTSDAGSDPIGKCLGYDTTAKKKVQISCPKCCICCIHLLV